MKDNLNNKENEIDKASVEESSSDKIPVEESSSNEVSVEEKNIIENIDFIIGRKVGMTQIFDENGMSYPVSVIDVEPNVITQIKTISNDGYCSIQLGMGSLKEKNKSKAYVGKFKNNNISIKSALKEFRVSENIVNTLKIGLKVTTSIFNIGDIVSVSGQSKGKGFAGVMKRHGFGGGRRSHGKNSVMRKPGAVGASADPARVWPGKAMAGRMGGENVTIRNLSILRVEKNRLFVNGSIPGSSNGIVYIKS